MFPAPCKVALSATPCPLGAAFVPPDRLMLQVATPAATHRAKTRFTEAASKAHPEMSIAVPSVGNHADTSTDAKFVQEPQ